MVDILTPTVHHTHPPIIIKSMNTPPPSDTKDKPQQMTQDYILTVDIYHYTPPRPIYLPPTHHYTYSNNLLVNSVLSQPIINHYFSEHDFVNWTILHRFFDNINDDKLAHIYKRQLIGGLPMTLPTKDRI